MNYLPPFILALFLIIPQLFGGTVLGAEKRQVVVYTALDQVFSEPILKTFETRYGIEVKAVYDIEAVKTTGLVNRLIAEKNTPRCDVFWNNEMMRTIVLKQKQVLARYVSPASADIPAQFKDKAGYWAGFAARARVLVVNTELLTEKQYPTSMHDLTDERWRGRFAIANPLFGTTATHMAAIYATEGTEEAERYLKEMRANDAKIVDGNSVVRDMTAAGEVLFGVTDTDDANVGIVSGLPLAMIVPDQQAQGTLLIPNTVALIEGAPHPEEGKLLIDYLLSKEVEHALAHCDSAQIPLREGIEVPKGQLTRRDLVSLEVDYDKMAKVLDESVRSVHKIFLR